VGSWRELGDKRESGGNLAEIESMKPLDSFEHLFDTGGMAVPSTDLNAALATLRSRWGAAAPGFAGEVVGALATVPSSDRWLAGASPRSSEGGAPLPREVADPDRVFSTGFAELDAILGPGGVPRGMGVSLRGDASSGRTTLALRLVAEAQAAGSIVAWLDLTAALDPVEAVARGIRPEWLVVLTPADPEEGLAIAGSLLAGRAVDLLVIDLPARLARRSGPAPGAGKGGTEARFADRLGRLAALARRAGISLVVLEPPTRPTARESDARGGLAAAVGEATGIRLELARRSWIRLGRDVVGQRTEVVVARNRAGPPGRRATLRILYADGGARDACLRRDDLLTPDAPVRPDQPTAPGKRNDATPPSPSPAPPPRLREAAPALRLVAGGAGGPRRPAVDERERPRRGPGRAGARRPARDAARVGAPAGAGGGLSRRGPGG
jgi:RecA/RadA recombinase